MRLLTIATMALLVLPACSKPPDALAESQNGARASAQRQVLDDQTAEQWSRSCALCHVDGTGGAPRVGDAAAWKPRLAKGEDTLLAHTIEGYRKMPPLGYCMDCGRDDFREMIRFMAGER